MDFKEYQKKALKTLTKGDKTPDILLARIVLGICGESGEIAEKIKKYFRGDSHKLHRKDILRELGLKKELGDLLWYIAVTAKLLKLDLNEIAEENIEKLASRKQRGLIKGSGDER